MPCTVSRNINICSSRVHCCCYMKRGRKLPRKDVHVDILNMYVSSRYCSSTNVFTYFMLVCSYQYALLAVIGKLLYLVRTCTRTILHATDLLSSVTKYRKHVTLYEVHTVYYDTVYQGKCAYRVLYVTL